MIIVTIKDKTRKQQTEQPVILSDESGSIFILAGTKKIIHSCSYSSVSEMN